MSTLWESLIHYWMISIVRKQLLFFILALYCCWWSLEWHLLFMQLHHTAGSCLLCDSLSPPDLFHTWGGLLSSLILYSNLWFFYPFVRFCIGLCWSCSFSPFFQLVKILIIVFFKVPAIPLYLCVILRYNNNVFFNFLSI